MDGVGLWVLWGGCVGGGVFVCAWVYGLCECMGAWVYVCVLVLWVSGCMNGVGVCG